jgi:hypothetical protein
LRDNADENAHFANVDYIALVLFILTNSLAKIATCAVLMALAPIKLYRLPTLLIEVIVLFWTIRSLVMITSKCTTIDMSVVCLDARSFWSGYCRLDVITDIGIMLSPLNLIRTLDLSMAKKATICLAFGTRLLSTLVSLFRVSSLGMLDQNGRDGVISGELPSLLAIAQIFFSVLAAFAPHLRPFATAVHECCPPQLDEPQNDDLLGTEGTTEKTVVARSRSVDVLKRSNLRSRANSPRL